MRVGLRTRYALSTSILTISVALVLASVSMWHFRQAFSEAAEAGVQALAETAETQLRNHGIEFALSVADNLAPPLADSRPQRVASLLQTAHRHHNIEYIVLFDDQGQVLWRGDHPRSEPPGSPLSERFPLRVLEDGDVVIREEGNILDLVVPVEQADRRLGGLWIGFSRQMLLQRLADTGARLSALESRAFREELLAVTAATLALTVMAVTVAVKLARSLTGPILALAGSAVRIGRAQPAPIDVHRDDEVGELAKALSAMQVSLRETTVSREFFGDIIHSLNDALLVTDPDMRVTLANRAAAEHFGQRETDLLGKPIDALIGGAAECDELTRWEPARGRVRAHHECELKTARHDSVPVMVSLSYIDGDRASPRAVFVLHNIAERKRMEDELRRYRDELEQLVAARTRELRGVNRELEAFSYSVSHDLRTPLRALNGLTEILLEDYGPRLDAEAQAHLKRIRGASERMSQMIDGMLILSRVARREITREPVDLSRLAVEVWEEIAAADPGRRVRFAIEPGLRVTGDPALLRLLLQNLLNNAWKFTAPKAHPAVEFGAREHPDGRVFSIRDNGIGFDTEQVEAMFKPFRRLQGSGAYEGSGIGLATVARIVARHGGDVWAEGEPGRGAAFCFTIPDPELSGNAP